MSEQSKSVLDGFSSLISERYREIFLLGTLLFSLFSVVALLGYAPTDPTYLHPNTGIVENPCGPLGAFIADSLFQTFGYGAWGTFAAMVMSVLALAGRPVLRPVRAVIFGILAVAMLGLIHMVAGAEGAFPAGGLIGQGTAESLVAVVGWVGASLTLGGVVLISVTILGNIRWGAVARRVVEAVEARWPTVRRLGLLGATSASDVMRRVVIACWQGLNRSVSRSISSVGSLGSRIASSFRTEVEEDEEEVFAGVEIDPDLFVPSDSVATAHSVPMVAEVQWEPTQAGDSEEIREMFTDLSPRNVQSSSGGSIVSSISEAVPEPLRESERTQPGQITSPGPATVASEYEQEDALPPMSLGVTLTPPVLIDTPAPRQRQLGVEVVEALQEKVSDDGGSVARKRAGWSNFKLPKLSLLDVTPDQKAHFDGEELRKLAGKVEETLAAFKVTGEVVNVRVGPVVTIFEFSPNQGIKVSKIANLADDLALALCALSVRIVAPIPGKGVVGIEIPSPTRLNIYFRELLASEAFRNNTYDLPVALGKNVEGKPIVANLGKMPHLLVAGTTGAGKSVGVNGMLMTLLYTCPPDELRLLLIDPKQLEFKMYDDIPHLLHPVVTDPKKAQAALDWAVREMEERYSRLAAWNTRNIVSYNEKVERESKNWSREKALQYLPKNWDPTKPLPEPEKMPFIVIVIDELADLMMVAKKEIEQSIARLAQKARACGIHLILATQRPSADVVTGLIKSNMPTRIAFKLKSALDSRVILDENGAEKLLGRGDMLHSPNGGEVERVHGAFVSDEEVERVCDYLRSQAKPDYIDAVTIDANPTSDSGVEADRDPLFSDAVDLVIGAGKASTSMVQRHLRIGYNRAARIVDQMEQAGVIGAADGARPREILVAENSY